MKLDLSPQLGPIRQILEGSLRLKANEPVPSVPSGLLDDLNQRYAPQRIVIEPSNQVSWVSGLRNLLRTPAFGLAAAAMIVFGVLTPFVGHQKSRIGSESFRGLSGTAATPAMVVLVDSPAGLEDTLTHSRSFEADNVVSVLDFEAAAKISNPKVVLDFHNATLRAIDSEGNTVHTAPLPNRISDLTLSVADALSRL